MHFVTSRPPELEILEKLCNSTVSESWNTKHRYYCFYVFYEILEISETDNTHFFYF